jgi:small redox-active disulfide protein 2
MPLIQVLGPGCPKCETLYERAKQAAAESALACDIEKVSDIQAILGFGVLSTPALVVDGTVKASGRIPTVAEIKEMIL